MQLVYAFIYYFTIFMTLCVASLAIFLIPLMRRLLVRFWRGYQHLMESDIVRYTVLLSFSLIGLVFLQSGYTLFVLESHFSTSKQCLS